MAWCKCDECRNGSRTQPNLILSRLGRVGSYFNDSRDFGGFRRIVSRGIAHVGGGTGGEGAVRILVVVVVVVLVMAFMV